MPRADAAGAGQVDAPAAAGLEASVPDAAEPGRSGAATQPPVWLAEADAWEVAEPHAPDNGTRR